MKFVLHSAIAAAALAVATPAPAAIIFDINTGLLTVDSTTTVGQSATVNFSGFAPNNPPIPGLTSTLTLTFQGLSGNNYLFDYLLTNTSGSPIDAARVTEFGFTSITPNPNLANSSVTGAFSTISSGNLPGGNDLELCAKNGQNNNCAGSQGGPGVGQSGSGNLVIAFDTANTQITLGGLAVRYQGIDSAALGIQGGSAIGGPTTPPPVVPEPATWAMLLIGFGATGFALRRRRRPAIAQLA
jgi:hypothetical protein